MTGVKRNYETHDGKFLAIISAFKEWSVTTPTYQVIAASGKEIVQG
jgi:hypothetical protein